MTDFTFKKILLTSSSVTHTLLKPSHDRQLLGATRILKVMSLELWYQTSAGLYVSVEMYGLLPVNSLAQLHQGATETTKKSVISIYIREGSIFHSEEQKSNILYTVRKTMKPVVIIYGLFGGVSECGARSCLTVRYVWLNLSLTDAIFISRETVTSHLTTGIKIKHFFGGENLFLWVYCHRLLKAALQLTCWEEYCAFSSE